MCRRLLSNASIVVIKGLGGTVSETQGSKATAVAHTLIGLGGLASFAVPAFAMSSGNPAIAWATPAIAGVMIAGHLTSVHGHNQRSKETEERLRSLTAQDEATGVSNRTGLKMLGTQLLETVRRKGDAVHAFVADTSHLTKGGRPLDSAKSDVVMAAVAGALQSSVRGTDVVARWSTSQFVVVGPGTGVHPGELERRVRTYLSEGPAVDLDTWPCRIVIGQASLAPWDAGGLDTLLEKAQQDFKMRRAMRNPTLAPPPVVEKKATKPTG